MFGKNMKMRKNLISLFLKNTFPHIIVCAILSLFYPAQTIPIFLIGTIFPDSYAFFYIYKQRKEKWIGANEQFKKMQNILHFLTLIISIICLVLGYKILFIAGFSHIVLDIIGF